MGGTTAGHLSNTLGLGSVPTGFWRIEKFLRGVWPAAFSRPALQPTRRCWVLRAQTTRNPSRPTPTRFPRHTAEEINSRIQREIAFSVQYYADHKDEIGKRLREL